MMVRQAKRPGTDELRAKFLANRDKVRSWRTDWACPEIEWPEFREVPSPWILLPEQEQQWLELHAPFMHGYQWFLEARPVAQGISRVQASWWFGEEHTFEQLDIEIRSVADPAYLAETLTRAVHAAALKGWRDEDVHALHAWLFDGLDTRPMGQGMRWQKRTGFILFEILRVPLSRTEIHTCLRITLTDTALDGSPLDDEGRVRPT